MSCQPCSRRRKGSCGFVMVRVLLFHFPLHGLKLILLPCLLPFCFPLPFCLLWHGLQLNLILCLLPLHFLLHGL